MESIYYTANLPDSFGSADGLKRQFLGSNGAERSPEGFKPIREIKDFLSRQDAYTLHRTVRRRFPRRKTLALGINDLWQADLVDLSSLAKSNDGYRYLFTCIDVISKIGRIALLKTKTGKAVTDAFTKMIKDYTPSHLQTDKGTEFLNSTFQELLRRNNIKFYTSQNEDIKAAIIERWHRTLMSKLYRYFTYRNTNRYVDVINDFVKSYNNTYHSSIGMAPSDVNEDNESEVRERLYGAVTATVPRLRVGDIVRISGAKKVFAKGYRDKWSEEIFKIVKVYKTEPITYGLTDLAGESITGKFYTQELQKVIKDVFRIEKVLKTRKRAGKTEYLVKWVGYSNNFNSWVNELYQ